MMRFDTDNKYPLLCRLRNHQWRRPFYPRDYESSWFRPASCHRCAHILKGIEEIEARWRATNAEAKAAGCKCGAEATHVRRVYGTRGSVAAEKWSCAAHTNVNGWTSNPDGTWRPHSPYDEDVLRWVSAPQRSDGA